jgi:hypothetical protein
MKAIRYVTAIAVLLALSACGGGGGGDSAPQPPPVQNTWDQMNWDTGTWA